MCSVMGYTQNFQWILRNANVRERKTKGAKIKKRWRGRIIARKGDRRIVEFAYIYIYIFTAVYHSQVLTKYARPFVSRQRFFPFSLILTMSFYMYYKNKILFFIKL